MLKQRMGTVGGVILAVVFALGGWLLTRWLIDNKEAALLSVTGRIWVDAPTLSPTPENSPPEVDDPEESKQKLPELTPEKVAAILALWESGGDEQPHEPRAYQLTMEAAMEAAKNSLYDFVDGGLLPEQALVYNKVNAYLCQRQGKALLPSELEPYCSYWTVTFSGADISATLVLNAVSGQIWRADLEYTHSGESKIDLAEALALFTAPLGFQEEKVSLSENVLANIRFENGLLYATLRKRSGMRDKASSFTQLVFFLTTTEPLLKK